MTASGPLDSPRLSWEPHRTPFSERFGDIYYDAENGLGESRHVFLRGCDLPEAWRDRRRFVIGELGFGTGLNFLTTWQLWKAAGPAGGLLHYIAVEGFPLTPAELRDCFDLWPELKPLSLLLGRAYPYPQAGFHRVFMEQEQVCLTLLFGPVMEMLAETEASVDAWYLDGFAPDRNPEMWQPDVFREMARLSHHGTRLASYTVAGQVRRDLAGAGFNVAKVPGTGSKRDVLKGRFQGPPPEGRLQPWFAHAPAVPVSAPHVAIIGSGLAGAATVQAFQRRNWTVTVIDRQEAVASEASGNPAAVLMPRLTAGDSLDGAYYEMAWRFALDRLEDISDLGRPLLRDRCGAVLLATTLEEKSRREAILSRPALAAPYLMPVSSREVSDLARIPISHDGLFFPQGGWLAPRDLCQAIFQDAAVLIGRQAAKVTRTGATWQVLDAAGSTIASADAVVIAAGTGTSGFDYSAWLPLVPRRGQISLVPRTETSLRLGTVLAGDGYVTPPHKGHHVIGATFDHVRDADSGLTVPQPIDEDNDRNLASIAQLVPGLLSGVDRIGVTGRAGVRCTTPDHLPIAGPAPDQDAYLRDFAELRHGHPWSRYEPAQYHPGLFYLTGLGARGLVSAPLAAELIASQANGEPWPMPRSVATALHPGRFLVRDLKRLKA